MPWYEPEEGRRSWYEEQGEGPVLVLLHGWCMSSAVWRFQADALSAKFRVVMPDLAGHGRSERPARCDLDQFTSDLERLFVQLDLRNVLLAGWSMGAQIVLKARAPLHERISAAALISGTPCFAAHASFPHGLGRTEVAGMELKVRRSVERAVAGFAAGMFAPGELDDPGLAQEVADVLAAVNTPERDVALQSLQALAGADLCDLLPRVDLPVLVINGDRDRVCLPEASAYMATHISNSTHRVIAGSGHAPFLTRAEEFNDCMTDFWERVSDNL